MRLPWRALVVLGGLVAAGMAWACLRSQAATQLPGEYRTASVTRGNVSTLISATGTVEPEEVVDVGAQVAGKVIAFGSDVTSSPIDYGSVVRQGDVLARLDDVVWASEATQAKAQLQQAEAGLAKSRAEIRQMTAKAEHLKREWDRAQSLGTQFESQSDRDLARADYEVAAANLEVAQAGLLQAEAEIARTRATVERAIRNLEYCTITSPVSGVVIDRRVNIGQTVVASLNAPSLFLIAKDLKRMQVWVAVNEADIGSVKPGQRVTFTADAFPGREFVGKVGKVRLNASMSQNVVTYTVEVDVDNSDETLIPYLTANVQFHTEERSNVLTVPNAALRWSPDGQSPRSVADAPATSGTVWLKTAEGSRPVPVRIGISDGNVTEVESEALPEGTQVIIGVQEASDKNTQASAGSANPFLPQIKPGKSGPPPPP